MMIIASVDYVEQKKKLEKKRYTVPRFLLIISIFTQIFTVINITFYSHFLHSLNISNGKKRRKKLVLCGYFDFI